MHRVFRKYLITRKATLGTKIQLFAEIFCVPRTLISVQRTDLPDERKNFSPKSEKRRRKLHYSSYKGKKYVKYRGKLRERKIVESTFTSYRSPYISDDSSARRMRVTNWNRHTLAPITRHRICINTSDLVKGNRKQGYCYTTDVPRRKSIAHAYRGCREC